MHFLVYCQFNVLDSHTIQRLIFEILTVKNISLCIGRFNALKLKQNKIKINHYGRDAATFSLVNIFHGSDS